MKDTQDLLSYTNPVALCKSRPRYSARKIKNRRMAGLQEGSGEVINPKQTTHTNKKKKNARSRHRVSRGKSGSSQERRPFALRFIRE